VLQNLFTRKPLSLLLEEMKGENRLRRVLGPVALSSLGIGAIIRHTAGAICAVVGVLFLLPLLFAPLGLSVQNAVQKFLPHVMAANSLTAVNPVAHMLSPGLTFGVLCAYAMVTLAAGAWALARRDA
jgi:hypothetical protein